jgi:hypothetical protein
MEVAEVWVTVAAATPLKVTLVAPVRFVPVMTTLVPTIPEAGVKLLIVGAGITVKEEAPAVVPSALVTLIFPLVAPVGTVALSWVSETMANSAATPLNVTAVAPVSAEPVMTTVPPMALDAGVKEETMGGKVTV